MTCRRLNGLWLYISLRSAQRQGALLLALPTLLVALSAASGQPITGQAWLTALLLTWPAAQALAWADLDAALTRDDTALTLALLGYSRAWLTSALLAPALLLCAVGVGLSVHPAAPTHPATPSLPRCDLIRDDALHAACLSLRAAAPLPPPRATLRRLAWADLPSSPHGDSERRRRLLEPCLGIPLGLLSLPLLSRFTALTALSPIPRALALTSTLLLLALTHALWSLMH